jgi:hypothetical protein
MMTKGIALRPLAPCDIDPPIFDLGEVLPIVDVRITDVKPSA